MNKEDLDRIIENIRIAQDTDTAWFFMYLGRSYNPPTEVLVKIFETFINNPHVYNFTRNN